MIIQLIKTIILLCIYIILSSSSVANDMLFGHLLLILNSTNIIFCNRFFFFFNFKPSSRVSFESDERWLFEVIIIFFFSKRSIFLYNIRLNNEIHPNHVWKLTFPVHNVHYTVYIYIYTVLFRPQNSDLIEYTDEML